METITDNLRKVKLSSTQDNSERTKGAIKKQTEEEENTKPTKNDVIHLYDICCGNLLLDSKSVFTINGWFCGLQKIELRWICSRCGHVQCSCYGEDSFFASQDYQSQGNLQVKARFNFDDSTGVGIVWCYDQKILSSLLKLSFVDWKHLTKAVLDHGGYFATEIKVKQEETCESHRMSYLKIFICYCGHPCLQRQVQLKCTLMHAVKKDPSPDWAPRPILKCVGIER